MIAPPDRPDSSGRPPEERDLAFYFALAQVGMEMVVPVALGGWLDARLGWSPWLLIVGAVSGFAGGLWHLLRLLKAHERRAIRQEKHQDRQP